MAKCYDNFSREELIELLNKQDKELALKKYGLVWDSEKEPEKVVLDCEKNLPILQRISEKEIKTDNSDYNILIEGDNFHALSVLNYTHKGKIDVIYIDPPYNTGNKDFKYNDSYVDKEDGYRHSKWLNFMEKRLNLAKNLLKPEGVIFISINNYEFAQLKMLCDSIFSENNFIGHIIWESTTQPINAGKAKFQLQQKTESIYCYAMNKKLKEEFILEKRAFKKNYPHKGKFGPCRFEIIEKSDAGQYKRNTMKFKILGQVPRDGKRWQIGEAEARRLENMGRIEIINGIVKKAIYPEDEKDKLSYNPFWSLFLADDVDTAQNGKEDLNSILGFPCGFDTVKPVALIEKILCHFPQNITVLDFFAGSGTTGHSVQEMNNKDNGTRKYILCTNDESEICTKICYPRIEKVINGYNKNGNREFVEGLGGNLQYFKTDFIKNSENIEQLKVNLTYKCTEMLCLKENIYNLKEEKDDYKIFESNKKDKYLCVYYNFINDSFEEFIDTLKQIDGEKIIYMFSMDDNINKELFEDIDNFKIETIPQKILDIYKKIIKENVRG